MATEQPYSINPFVATVVAIDEPTLKHNTPADWRLGSLVATDHCVLARWERGGWEQELTVRPDAPTQEWGVDTPHRIEFVDGGRVATVADGEAFADCESVVLAALRVLYRQSDAVDEDYGPARVDPADPPRDEAVRLITGVTRQIHHPAIIRAHVSGSGQTIRVPATGDYLTTDRQLDARTIFAGDTEIRDSRSFELYTPLRYLRAQRANKAPGPQAGVNSLRGWRDLPPATHLPADSDADDRPGECEAADFDVRLD